VTEEAGAEQVITQERPAPLSDLVGKAWRTQYRIVRLVGCGGMGEVWAAASDDLPGTPVAVKVISREHAHQLEVIERFFGEARAASALDDPNVVKIMDTGRLDDGRPVLVMEFIDGPSLQTMVEAQGPLPIDVIGQLMIQAASALRAAHARSIIHRDIKPSNLLVSKRWGRDAFLTVVDFGIAKLGDPQLAGKIRTRTKAFIGTPGFIAPEQALGKPIDTKADIYALGVVLYHALTGRLPYHGDSELETLNLQVTGAPFPAPIDLRPDTPPAWNELVLDCVEVDRVRRPTAVELARRIASGLPNGATLLKALAPSIAVHRGPSAMFAATLSGDVPTALSQLSAAHVVPRTAGPERAAKVALVAAGALLGCLVTLLAVRLLAPAEPVARRDDRLEMQPAPDTGLADAAQLAGRAADAGSPDAASIAALVTDAGTPDAAAPDAVVEPPDSDATSGGRSAKAPVPAPPVTGRAGGTAAGAASARNGGQIVQAGVIIVR
jgi:serine/threonine-protein kinase